MGDLLQAVPQPIPGKVRMNRSEPFPFQESDPISENLNGCSYRFRCSEATPICSSQFALSCSWDKTLRLWDLSDGTTARRFVDHDKDVLSVAFSADNRQIVSGARDKSIKLWNTLGQCKYTISDSDAHTDWVSCVRFSPNTATPLIVSGGWDKVVKVWNLTNCKLKTNLVGHKAQVNTVTVSPDGSLCASGGKDGLAMLWDLNEGKHLYVLDAGNDINALCFSPNRYWLCAATNEGIKIWDLETTKTPSFLSLAWSADGNTLFAGYD